MHFSSAHKQPATMSRAPQHPRRAGVEGLGGGWERTCSWPLQKRTHHLQKGTTGLGIPSCSALCSEGPPGDFGSRKTLVVTSSWLPAPTPRMLEA